MIGVRVITIFVLLKLTFASSLAQVNVPLDTLLNKLQELPYYLNSGTRFSIDSSSLCQDEQTIIEAKGAKLFFGNSSTDIYTSKGYITIEIFPEKKDVEISLKGKDKSLIFRPRVAKLPPPVFDVRLDYKSKIDTANFKNFNNKNNIQLKSVENISLNFIRLVNVSDSTYVLPITPLPFQLNILGYSPLNKSVNRNLRFPIETSYEINNLKIIFRKKNRVVKRLLINEVLKQSAVVQIPDCDWFIIKIESLKRKCRYPDLYEQVAIRRKICFVFE